MPSSLFRYQFVPSVPAADVEVAIVLALLAAEFLHGETLVRLSVSHAFDAESRTCVIDASSGVGRDFNRLFVGFITRECGPGSFRVTPVAASPAPVGAV